MGREEQGVGRARTTQEAREMWARRIKQRNREPLREIWKPTALVHNLCVARGLAVPALSDAL